MRTRTALALCLAITGTGAAGCVSDSDGDAFDFEQTLPEPMSGKADDPVRCGEEACLPNLCGYDTSVAGEQAVRGCAEADGRPDTFVAASVGGSESGSFDSRDNPYVPHLSLDNVLIYGCELWDFSDQRYDGLEIEYQELIHSSFTVNPNDPTRTKKDFKLYVNDFRGPGSYRGTGRYASAHDATLFYGQDACEIDAAVDDAGTLSGQFSCTIPARSGSGSVSVSGSWSCGKNAMRPIFSRWAAAPQ